MPPKTTSPASPNDDRKNHDSTINGAQVTEKTKDYPEPQRDLVRWFFAYGQIKGLSRTELGKCLEPTADANTLYKLFLNRYEAKIDNLCKRIETFKVKVDRLSTIQGLEFIETDTSKKIFNACRFASQNHFIVMVYGDGQIGKTTAFEEYTRQNNHGATKYIRMPASGGVQLMMKELARACFISPNSCFDNLRNDVLKAIDHNNLVIVDEMHQVWTSYHKGSAIKCVEVLREIYDRTGCGMVLCGTNVFKDQFKLGQQKELLKQIHRRGLEINMPAIAPRVDLDALSAGFGLEPAHGKAEEIMLLIAKEHGIGKFMKFMQAGSARAKKQKRLMEWSDFIKAYNDFTKLGGENK